MVSRLFFFVELFVGSYFGLVCLMVTAFISSPLWAAFRLWPSRGRRPTINYLAQITGYKAVVLTTNAAAFRVKIKTRRMCVIVAQRRRGSATLKTRPSMNE